MIDTHAHLDFPEFENDLAEALERATRAGVTSIIAVGTNPDSSLKSVHLAEKHENIYAAVGIHPNECARATDSDWARIKELAANPRVVAIGETGLDFHRDSCPRDVQEESFRRTISLAAELDRPIIVHCREAAEDCLRVLKDSGRDRIKGVMHCYSGTAGEVEGFLSLGLWVSFAGQLTFPNAEDLRQTAKMIPLERTLLETDCPFLAPQSHRGERNEPAFMRETLEQLAKIHGVSPADVNRMTTVSAYRAFKVGQRPPRGSIAYTIRNTRYLNITNRCTNRCVYCSRKGSFYLKGYHLLLESEPTLAQIISAAGDLSKYDELVFSGLGEPTMRLDEVKAMAKHAKSRGIRTRLNTNGQGSLINHRDICPELVGLIDRVSINLVTTDPAVYQKLCRPEDPSAHRAVMKFVEEAKKTFPEVEVTSVDIPEVKVEALKAWAASKGVGLRLRNPRKINWRP